MHQKPSIWEHHSPHTTQHPMATRQTQIYTQYLQQSNNSFTEKQNSATTQASAAALVGQLQQILNIHKNQNHQVNEVQAAKSQASTTWDLKTAAELPVTIHSWNPKNDAQGNRPGMPTDNGK